MNTETFIRILTISALSGLLATVGLRLTVGQVIGSLRQCRFSLILLINFIVVPALTLAAARVFGVRPEFAIGMLLLASAPFAPVVPVFAKMARADLALAAGLTSVIPVLSAFLTPFVCELTLKGVPNSGTMDFKMTGALLTLLATITVPLGIGVVINHQAPALGRRLLGPVEALAEATGAMSLAFLVFHEFHKIIALGWRPLLAMSLVMETSMVLGYWVGGQSTASRRVTALGTGNRNIALAVLVAIQSFTGTDVVAAVVANGLLMIVIGLIHVAFWRFFSPVVGKENPA
jgi:BASS family bile acid:Na+ symporter